MSAAKRFNSPTVKSNPDTAVRRTLEVCFPLILQRTDTLTKELRGKCFLVLAEVLKDQRTTEKDLHRIVDNYVRIAGDEHDALHESNYSDVTRGGSRAPASLLPTAPKGIDW